jgi:hypothetical protein
MLAGALPIAAVTTVLAWRRRGPGPGREAESS